MTMNCDDETTVKERKTPPKTGEASARKARSGKKAAAKTKSEKVAPVLCGSPGRRSAGRERVARGARRSSAKKSAAKSSAKRAVSAPPSPRR